jgi:hypothetical protein
MTTLAQISETQAQKATTANENFDALAYAGLFGRRAAGISGLTWAYYGGILYVDGVATAIADGTVALTLNLTNYVEATRAGVVSANTVGFTAGRIPLYTVVCGATTISSYADKRALGELFTRSRLSLAVAGGVGTTVLTRDQAAVRILELTGALTGNRTLEVPAVAWIWSVFNNTTGAFSLTLKTNAGTGIAVTQGKRTLLYCDGTNVVDVVEMLSSLSISGALTVGGTATFNGALTASPANASVTLSPTGSGTVTVNPATAGTLNNVAIGGTTAAAVKGTTGTFTGALDLSAAGAGQIGFPATQNPSAGANTLDDYEEGTWTPSLNFSGGTTGITYGDRQGRYIKIGKNVNIFHARQPDVEGQLCRPRTNNRLAVRFRQRFQCLSIGVRGYGRIHGDHELAAALSGHGECHARSISTSARRAVISPLQDPNFTNTTFWNLNFAYEATN